MFSLLHALFISLETLQFVDIYLGSPTVDPVDPSTLKPNNKSYSSDFKVVETNLTHFTQFTKILIFYSHAF